MNGKKILIVDDDPNIIKLLGIVLEKEGFITEHAQTGEEAMQKSRDFVPDLIIMDLVLPDVDGAEVVTRLIERTSFKNMPKIIFVSGVISNNDASSEFITVKQWQFPIIAKPLDIKRIKSAVKEILQ